jgi:hypothetical protein
MWIRGWFSLLVIHKYPQSIVDTYKYFQYDSEFVNKHLIFPQKNTSYS